MTLECLVIADDLTGACDAAGQFAARGLRTWVALDTAAVPSEIDVLAINTESRDAGLGSFRSAIERLPAYQKRHLFKKIDSTLRGQVGPETAAALEVFACDAAIVTPAFPEMGRIVEGGYLKVQGEIGFVPRRLADCFHGLSGEFLLRDAVTDADLDAIVAEGVARGGRLLWAGSAGLAAALARAIGRKTPGPIDFAPGPPTFCLGSDHTATLEQERRLIELRPECPVVRLKRDENPDRIRQLLADHRTPLVLSGGDTASMVCRAIGVRGIELRGEVTPGIPAGILRGGPFESVPVVTKSGGFGGPDALMQVADFFTCSQPSH